MAEQYGRVVFTGANPGADTTERTIFDSQVEPKWDKAEFEKRGIRRLFVRMSWDAGETQTLKAYYCHDRAVSAAYVAEPFAQQDITPTATDDVTFDLDVEGLADVKITLTNGGGAKTKHHVTVTPIGDRSPVS